MTQIQFGALIGVQVGKYENGTDRIAASSAVHLAEQLGISVDDLLGLNGLDGSQRHRTGQNTPRFNRTDPEPG
jgi:transcriptional regulator with XRE-family HTH domain